ncbi:retrovirus-related Pol polyprotein from transposon 297 [Trichonephila clavipes]|nr:retrovirus-related Pol polyprotein from transposon 297 [Trichonephila clavipes]
MSEKALVAHIFVKLEPQVQDYMEVRYPENTVQLLEVLAKFKERYSCKAIRGSRNSDNVDGRGWNERRMSNVGNNRGNRRNSEVVRRPSNGRNDYRGHASGEVIYIRGDIPKIFFYKPVKKSRTQVITAQGAKCQNIGIVELNIRIREFEKPLLFHALAHLEYPCILGIDFISGSKIILDFDRKSLAIPDSQIDKVVKTVEEEKREIDLSKTKFTVDYRNLNAITKYRRYPLPLIDDLIMNIPHTAIMLALDLRSGYFQVAVNPSDIVKTAFVTKNGTYAFRRMPFDLSVAAPNFQKAIDTILKPVIGKFVNLYMDNVIISSPSFTQHIEHLKEVLRLLHEAELTLNKDKCKFGCDELK